MHKIKLFALSSMVSFCACFSTQSQAQTDTTTPLVALFIYNFVNFVEWPSAAFDTAQSPIRACWYGASGAANYLAPLDGTMVGNRELQVIVTPKEIEIAKGCHLLFVEESRKAVLPDFWKDVNYMFVLSIGEQNEFTERGGVIRIVRTADQLEFDANINNAKGAGIFLSSDLLRLARKIKGINGDEE